MIDIRGKISNKVLRNSTIYVLSSTINASVPFFLLPIMTSCLSPEDYGITAMFQMVLGFMLPIVGLTMDGAIGLEYYIKETGHLGKYIGNCFFWALCSFVLCLGIVSMLSGTIEAFVGLQVYWVLLALAQTILQFICTVCLTLWQVSQNPIKYAFFQFDTCFLNGVLSVGFVYFWRLGYEGRLYANFIAILLFAIIAFCYVLRKYQVSFSLNKKMMKDALNYGVPLIPHSIGGWCLSLVDRFFLLNMVGLVAVGKYSVAFQLASVLGFLTLGANQAFVPWLYENLGNATSVVKRKIVKATYLFMGLILLCAVVYSLILPIIQSYFINERFNGIEDFFYILLIGFCFQGFYYFFVCYIGYRKKTKYVSLITVTEKIDEDGVFSGRVVTAPRYHTYKSLLYGNEIGCLTVIVDTAKVGRIEFKYIGHEDYECWLSILKKGYVAKNTQQILAAYRVRKSSVSSNKLKAMRWIWNIYRKHERLNYISAFCHFLSCMVKSFIKYTK